MKITRFWWLLFATILLFGCEQKGRLTVDDTSIQGLSAFQHSDAAAQAHFFEALVRRALPKERPATKVLSYIAAGCVRRSLAVNPAPNWQATLSQCHSLLGWASDGASTMDSYAKLTPEARYGFAYGVIIAALQQSFRTKNTKRSFHTLADKIIPYYNACMNSFLGNSALEASRLSGAEVSRRCSGIIVELTLRGALDSGG